MRAIRLLATIALLMPSIAYADNAQKRNLSRKIQSLDAQCLVAERVGHLLLTA